MPKLSGNRIVATEADLREQIRTLAELYGWLMYFTWNSRNSPDGFPDLVLVHPERRQVIFAELKAEGGRLTEQQKEWLSALMKCGQMVSVWKPSHIHQITWLLQPPIHRNAKQTEV